MRGVRYEAGVRRTGLGVAGSSLIELRTARAGQDGNDPTILRVRRFLMCWSCGTAGEQGYSRQAENQLALFGRRAKNCLSSVQNLIADPESKTSV